MGKIPAIDLVHDFQAMHKQHWAYAWSGCEKGKVSCSGAFTWAYKQFSKEIYQGSNRIARVYVVALIPYSDAKRQGIIVPGMAAFKTRHPGDKWYALPDTYKPGGKYHNGDLDDYYHIGLVDSDTNYVLNAQSAKTGFVRSKITENWSHVALLRDVEYGETPESEESSMGSTATVIGGRLKMRTDPSTKSAIITFIPNGSTVTVESNNGDWCAISYDGKTGYVMSEFLSPDNRMDYIPVEPPFGNAVAVYLTPEMAIALRDELNRVLGGGLTCSI